MTWAIPALTALFGIIGACVGVADSYRGGDWPPEAPSRGAWVDAGDRLVLWLHAELDEDLAAMRQTTAKEITKSVLATVLFAGLGVRAAIHTAAYLLGNPGGEPEIDLGLVADPVVSRRPAWNSATARYASAALCAWFVQSEAFALSFATAGEAVVSLLAAANFAVLAVEPIIASVQFLNQQSVIDNTRKTES